MKIYLTRRIAYLAAFCLIFLLQSCDKYLQNEVPTASAEATPSSTTTDGSISLHGSGTDADGTIKGYLWSQVSGPGLAIIANPGSANTTVYGFTVGNYIFQLMVTDDKGSTGIDTVHVAITGSGSCTETGTWIGSYLLEAGSGVEESPALFINDGIATLVNSPYSYFWTTFVLPIPSCRELNIDTLRLEVRLKNPSTGIYDYDAAIQLRGDVDTAYAQYIGIRQEFTSFGLKHYYIANRPNLVHTFEDFSNVLLQAKDNILTTKIDGVVKETLDYTGHSIGILKDIRIAFKGVGAVDWVKLYSSQSGNLLMQEDFNTDGASNVVWY